MDLQQFKQLNNAEQARLLQQYGVFLATRFLDGNRIYLFSLSSFYVELFHQLSDLRRSNIRILRAFEDTVYLDTYLDEINLTEVLLPQ